MGVSCSRKNLIPFAIAAVRYEGAHNSPYAQAQFCGVVSERRIGLYFNRKCVESRSVENFYG
jgi:hypothetical protein